MEKKIVLMIGAACDRTECISTTLSTCGYSVQRARDALEAIERLNAGERIDLLVMHSTEDAMGFREAREFLRTSGYESVPTILLTGSDCSEEFLSSGRRFRMLGASEPLDWFELIRTTQELIGSARPSEVWLD